MGYNNRQFIIFNVSELEKIDFKRVIEESIASLRTSNDGQKTFVKWDGIGTPICVTTLTTKEGPYNYEEMIEILNRPEWVVNL